MDRHTHTHTVGICYNTHSTHAFTARFSPTVNLAIGTQDLNSRCVSAKEQYQVQVSIHPTPLCSQSRFDYRGGQIIGSQTRILILTVYLSQVIQVLTFKVQLEGYEEAQRISAVRHHIRTPC